jgi:GNAT superfamily N-acetyltransferase
MLLQYLLHHIDDAGKRGLAMSSEKLAYSDLAFQPLTLDRWADFEKLFGPHGAYGGCWCMYWRTTRSQFEKQGNPGNRQAMHQIVQSGEVPGILAYHAGEVVGWCSVAPRDSYPSLNRSPVLKKLDDEPVWSIVCFYIAREHRGRGLTLALIQAAIDYVREQGGRIVEAYPTRPRGRQLPPVSSYMGLPALFEQAGFVECAQPSKAKLIMRYYIE